MKATPSIDDQIKVLEDYRNIRSLYMQRVQAVREIHEAAGNVELATAAQREYDRLVRNDDKLLNQIEELQGRKAFAPESQRQD